MLLAYRPVAANFDAIILKSRKTDMSENVDRLLEIMAKLRSPDDGCPWDVEQTFKTIAPYTIEEAYEVADAIEGTTR